MGFFTQLGDLWGDSNNYGFGKSWDSLGDAWGHLKDTGQSVASGLWGIATSPFQDKQSVWDAFLGSVSKIAHDAPGQSVLAGMSVLGAATELPLVKQLVGTAGWVQNEFVKRPLTTGYLMTGDVARGNASYFDGDKWAQAYKDSVYVSTGQAAVYSAYNSGFGLGDHPELDPRSMAAQQAYRENQALRYQSGAIDAAVDIFADPTIYGGKAVAALKLKYISKPIRTADDVAKFRESDGFTKLHEYIKQAPNPEVVRQQVFNSHRGGDKAAALLWDVRNDDHLYNATFDSLYGDPNAWQYLTQNAERIAEVTGNVYANQTMADAANKVGQSSKADAIVSALRETKTQAFLDAIANSNKADKAGEAAHGAWATSRGVLMAQATPRLSVTSKWRAGVHNWLTFGPEVFRGTAIYPIASRARYVLPSAKFTRFMDVNDVNSVGAFRSNLERSPLSRDQVEQFVSQYGRASSPESRARIAATAEDTGFKVLAGKHGFTPEDAEAALPAINRLRTTNRQVFRTSQRFLSKDALQLYNKYVAAGRVEEADNVFFLSQEIQDAIKRGDQPGDFFHMLDEDGNSVFVPGKFQVDPEKPVLLSQNADIVAMQDWRSLDTGLWWTKHGPVGKSAYTMINGGASLLEYANQAWKITTLLRPGYVWRMLSDDVLRRGSLYGATGVLMSTSRGVKNAAINFARKGGLVADAVYRDRRLNSRNNQLQAVDDVDADVDDLSSAFEVRQPVGGRYEPTPQELQMSVGGDRRLRDAIVSIDGMDSITKNHLRKSLKVGNAVADRVIQQLIDRKLIEFDRLEGRVKHYKAHVEPGSSNLAYQPFLDYRSYDAALADGVMSVGDYLKKVDEHANRGDLPPDLAQLVQGRNDGTLAPKDKLDRVYRQQVIDRALTQHNRAQYANTAWTQAFIDWTLQKHVNRKQGEHTAFVVDPTTGTVPTHTDIKPDTFTLTNGRQVSPHVDSVYDYVADNMDEILKPNSLLHMYVAPSGQLSLSVARYSGKVTPKVVKDTAGIRVKFRDREGPAKAMLGATKVRAMTPYGPVTVAAAFDGAEGARFRAQASAQGPQGAWGQQVADTEYARLLNESHTQRDVAPTEPHYATSWERAVNAQLHNDQVARMFMDGKTEGDVLNWMRNSPDGRAYWGRMGPWQSRPVDQITAVRAMVDTYLPEPHMVSAKYADIGDAGDAFTAAQDLRQKALAGTARYPDFEKLFPNKEDLPAVHGASLDVTVGGPFSNFVKKKVNQTFKILSDIPADRASRFPFFAERYEAHVRDLAPLYAQYAGNASFLHVGEINRLQREARNRALADVKKYLFDTSAALDMAAAGKLIVPFSSAVADSFLKWGVIARERGLVAPVLNIWKFWTAPDRAGLVQDENGNQKRWNPQTLQYDWYGRTPVKGPDGKITFKETLLPDHDPKQEYVVFRLPSAINTAIGDTTAAVTFGAYHPTTRLPDGTVMPTYINKETFNTFLGLPTAGPIVAIPANEFELRNPKAADNAFMRKFVLPFGPTSDRYKAFLPSNVRNTYNLATSNEQSRRGIAQAVMQTEYTRFALGERDKPPTMEEVQHTADDIYAMQFLSQFWGLSAQERSPYQPYIDYYRQLEQKAGEDKKNGVTDGWGKSFDGTVDYNPLARFYNEMGDEYRMLTSSVTRNVAGLPASVEGAAAQKKYAELIAKFPDLAPLIVGAEGAGAFNQAVYQAQLDQTLQPGSDQKMRQVLSLQDSEEDAERRYVWVKYGKMMDAIKADMEQRNIKTLSSNRAKDLKKIRDQFIEDHKTWTNPQGATDVNPWFTEFSTTDRARMTARLTAMAQIVTDPNSKIGERDDMRGLLQYLQARTEVRQQMQAHKITSLSSNKARALSNQWNVYVSDLTEQNVSFAALYNRWLTNDDLTADILFDQ